MIVFQIYFIGVVLSIVALIGGMAFQDLSISMGKDMDGKMWTSLFIIPVAIMWPIVLYYLIIQRSRE